MSDDSRWGRMMERRATELLSAAAVSPTLVVAAAGGYEVLSEVRRSSLVLATAGATLEADVGGDAAALPFADATFASVIDTSQPEEPAEHARRLAELLRVCRPGGTVATIACGGPAGNPALRSWAGLQERVRDHGPAIEQAVPFDVFGTRSRWSREDVLAELESHLRAATVRRAARFLDRHVVAALPPEEAGSVALVLRRTLWTGRATASSTANLRAVLASRPFARRVLELMRDDAVARFAAFLDTAVLSPAGVPFHLVRYLVDAAADPELASEACAGLLPRRLWWTNRRDAQRTLAAASHRLAQRTVAALARLPGARADGVSLPETLEYELMALFNRELGRWTEEGP